MNCPHTEVAIIEDRPLEGETYGDLYGQCCSCGQYLKAYGHIEDSPGRLERQGEWEIDKDVTL